jgi:adenine-specific DNA methylase
MAKSQRKSKKELLTDQIAIAVGAGREVADETVDFSDPNRPKTCLEVDFPIIPINQIAAIEGKGSGALKPIYQVTKWWARRRSTVFRAMLLAATTKAPDDETRAAKTVWDVYYANHQKLGTLRHLTVADPFMGGGTTIVEGSRLGMQMFGCDLNPVAWFVTKNEMSDVNIEEVKRLLADIEAEVKPQIMPYYASDGPNGERGKWFRRTGNTEEMLPDSFDYLSVPWQERKDYRYEGPEVIYTFWAKHGPCQREGCGHRTPIMSTPVIANKSLTTEAWVSWECRGCGKTFDVERHVARMASGTPLFVVPDERPFVVMDKDGRFVCPYCGQQFEDRKAALEGNSITLGKTLAKKVELTLLIHPQWLEGCPKHDKQGREYGGSATDSVEATVRWANARAEKLRLLEVRGKLPEQVTCPTTGITFYTTEKGGTIPKRSTFACAVDGTPNDVLEAIRESGKTGPLAPYAVQASAPTNGELDRKFFTVASNTRQWEAVLREWEERKTSDLSRYWPTSELPYGFMTHHLNGGIPNHGFTHWWKMFNPRQLLVHSLLLKAIATNDRASAQAKFAVLGVFQQYLRNNNLFCFWNSQRALEPMFSNNNFHPKSTLVESSVFTGLARGDFAACAQKLLEAVGWCNAPWEIATFDNEGHSDKVLIHDKVLHNAVLECSSASQLVTLPDSSYDLVVTDPPFGGLLHYSELSDFFYVWLRLVLRSDYPEQFTSEYTPKALEAVSNEARQPGEGDAFYQRILTDCWREAFRVLKPGGILTFTFHHSEDEPWVGVLESLFDAGFYLEATYPIRSDETKGEGEFGSKKIEYDIIHVCRKRLFEPQPISWARLRRLIVDDVRRIKNLLSQHQKEGLPAADLQVIKRGKALEYFSRHYGKVYIEQGREFTIREALVGINQLLDDDTSTTGGPEAPPSNAEPYTRQFFRLFYETTQVPRDQMQKFLRGTGIAPSDFEERGWCSEKNKVFILTPPLELARAWKGASRKGMARDFDQTMFLVGGCVEGSSIRVTDTLDSPNFAPHPATAELVDWLTSHGGSQEIKFAAQRARTIYRDWLGKNKTKAQEQMKLFDLQA